MQNSIKFLMPLEVGFWSVLGGFWEAKWSQVGTDIPLKIDCSFKKPIAVGRLPRSPAAWLDLYHYVYMYLYCLKRQLDA